MRLLVASVLAALTACAPHSRISAVPGPGPAGPRQPCPYRPVGANSYVLLRVVSTRGDTLAGAHVTVTRRRPDHGALLPPLEAQAPDSGGWYRLGPLRSSENLVEVAHPGYRPARYTVQLCTTDTVWLLASLFPE